MDEVIERLLGGCRSALTADDPARAVEGVVRVAVREPQRLRAALGAATAVGQLTLLQEAGLTVQRIVWGPGITSTPHEHGTWAVVGVYAGEELNVRWRVDGDRLREAGRVAVGPGEVLRLGPEEAHAVVASGDGFTEGLHVYGGDIARLSRREWVADVPRPFEPADTVRAASAYNAWVEQAGRLPTADEGAALLREAGYPLPSLGAVR